MASVMSQKGALIAIRCGGPIVIESRKYGIVANWWTARSFPEFTAWLRGRVAEGAYPEEEYGRAWRAWSVPPTEEERRGTPWP